MTALHFICLRPDMPRLARWAAQTRQRALAADIGYAVHSATRAVFGALAPKPFCLRQRGGAAELVGYVRADGAELRRVSQLGLHDAAAAQALGIDEMVVKTMPDDWKAGERFSFEVRVAPVVRSRAAEPGRYVEVDAAYHPQYALQSPGDRDAAYTRWLRHELARGGAAELVLHRTQAFALGAMARRTQTQSGAGRAMATGLLPDLTVRGELQVGQAAALSALLERGLGRHRAFGYGCLLLAPPGALAARD